MTAKKIVTKSELAVVLGWARTRLDRRLRSDQKFPVWKRGNQAGGWEFDVEDVVHYLEHGQVAGSVEAALEQSDKGAPAAPTGPRTPPVLGRRIIEHRGEQTAKQRLENAKAIREEIKAHRENGSIVDVDEVRQELNLFMARLGKALDVYPNSVAKRLDLPDENVEVMREMMDELRRATIAAMRAVPGCAGEDAIETRASRMSNEEEANGR